MTRRSLIIIGFTAGRVEGGTGPDKPSVYAQLDRIDVLAGTSWTRLGNALEGKTRGQNRGHEHFGFLDGVSQPGVRGQIDSPHRGSRPALSRGFASLGRRIVSANSKFLFVRHVILWCTLG
jgi:hypothetical protein